MLWRLSATLAICRPAARGASEQSNAPSSDALISSRPAVDCSSTFSTRSTKGRSRRSAPPPSEPLNAAAAAAVALRGSDGGGADRRLRPFVDRVENVLEQSTAGRDEIKASLDGAFDCSLAPRAAGRQIASVADNRRSILLQLGTLQTPTEQADDVDTQLQAALQHSIEADRHYRDGLFAVPPQTDCPLPPNPNFQLAARSNAEATAAKRRFVAAFNPLAERFGRRTWSADQI